MCARLRSLFDTLLVAVAGCYFACPGAASGQDREFRSFTNKDGQVVEAKVISVSSDRTRLRGELRNGREFEMAINLLSLDDQQFLQRWLKENPAVSTTTFQLDVTFEKKEETIERKRDDYYRFTVRSVTYEVAVRNKTREPLPGGWVEYAMIHKDGLDIARSDAGIPITYIEELNPERKIISGRSKLPDSLAFNFSHEFTTEAISTDMVEVDGNGRFDSDEVLGVLARVSDGRGQVIGIFRSNESGMRDITWESAAGDKPPPAATATRVKSAKPLGAQTKSSEGVEVRRLDSWPETFQVGDTLVADKIPEVVRNPVVISAIINIDTDVPDGVIVAHGGAERGYGLFVFESQLQFWVKKKLSGNRRLTRKVTLPLADLPDEEFSVEARLGADTHELWIDGKLAGKLNSFGFLESQPGEGLSIGYDSERGSVGPASANVPFRGQIREVRIEIGE